MKKFLIGAAMAAAPLALCAQTSESAMAEQYFSQTNPSLTNQEKAGLNISEKWMSRSGEASKPVPGEDGTVRFVYGASQPSIVCAVMQVCDVELQPGEVVNSVNVGDAVRWLVEPAISGAGPAAVQHLIIKPLDVGLDSSLVVATNIRIYHIRLRSHRSQYMPRVAFIYPEVAAAKWAALQRAQQVERQRQTIPATREYLGDLNFNYKVSGRAPWKPVRVYHDGRKTIIEMPKTLSQGEAPTLMAIRDSQSVLKKDEQVLLNYRLQGNRYIVDSIIDKAMLVAGTGRGQMKITIERTQ